MTQNGSMIGTPQAIVIPQSRTESVGTGTGLNVGTGTGLDIERRLWKKGFLAVAGTDEVGRGCLAGPVVAAAVILPTQLELDGVQDSKTLSRTAREKARERILEAALAVATASCSPVEIDRLNILQASLEAMRRAVESLVHQPDYLLIDGNRYFTGIDIPFACVVRGDARCQSIAAASIIAKTYRDDLMRRRHEIHPEYGWDRNVGYPTKEHYRALRKFGPVSEHRRSFRLS